MELEKNTGVAWYENVSYAEKIELAKEKLSNMVGSFVEAGYWIRSIWEDEECEKHGYATIWDMAEAEFGLKKSEASRAINMNKKYSVGGNSPVILAKYSMYSKSQLQEMLTIKNGELEQKVTADMTVEEIRQLKKDWRNHEEEKEPAEPVNTESDKDLEKESITVSVATSQEPVNTESNVLLENEIIEEIEAEEEEIVEYLDFEKLDDEEGEEKEEITIIDGEFREIPVLGELSAYGFTKTEYPEGSSIQTKGCGHKYNCFNCAQECEIRQESMYCREAPLGNPFSCTTMNVLELLKVEMEDECQFVNHELAYHTAGSHEPAPCCKNCQVKSCGYRCGRSAHIKTVENNMPEVKDIQKAAVETKEITDIKKILETEKKLLNSYLEFDDLPESTLARQKIIVGALANMLCELENMEEQEVQEQPELTILKNNDQRQEFIAGYREWKLWIEQPLTGERYYRYEFENGTAFVVRVYFHKCFDIAACNKKWEDRYKDDWGAEEYYIVTEGKHFKDCLANKSQMIEFLKNLQKGEK